MGVVVQARRLGGGGGSGGSNESPLYQKRSSSLVYDAYDRSLSKM